MSRSLDSVHSLVVIGAQPDDTARVALGVARAQAHRRRVVIADLLGDAPPLRGLVRHDDFHGIVDSFLYGVSLARLMVRVEEPGELYLLPTGTEPPPYDDVFTNPRWGRLASGFRERGGLLVIAAAAGAPHIERLTSYTDGAVLVGESMPPDLPEACVLAAVRMPLVAVPGADTPRVGSRRVRRFHGDRAAAAAGIVLSAALVAAAAWLAWRPLADSGRTPTGQHRDTITSTGQAALRSDSLRRDALLGTLHDPREPVAINPADSTAAAAYAVSVVNMNTMAGARSKLQAMSQRDPTVTYAPLQIGEAPWFQIRVGAFTTAAAAESLLASMRAEGRVEGRVEAQGGEAVVRAPFAFLLDSLVTGNRVRGLVDAYRRLDVPAYALRQADGSYHVYAGTFATPRESIMLADSLRAKGLDTPLVYRLGRVY